MNNNNSSRYNLIFGLLFILIYSFIFSGYKNEVMVDEPWESITAHYLASEGKLYNPVLENRDYYDVHFLEPRIIQSVILSLFYNIFSTNLLVGRTVTILIGLVGFFYLFRLFRTDKYSTLLSLLGVGLLLVNNFYYVYSRMIRPEILFTTFGIIAFYYLYLNLRNNNRNALVFAGIFSGLGLLTHPNFILMIFSYVVIWAYEKRKGFFTSRGTYTFLITLVITISPYIVYLFIQDYENGFHHFWEQVNRRALHGTEGFWFQTFIDEMDRYRGYIYYPYRVLVVAIELFFIAATFKYKDKLSVYSRLVIITHLVLFPILIVSRVERYFLPIIPFIIVLIIRFFGEHRSHESISKLFNDLNYAKKVGFISVFILIGYQIIGNAVITMQTRTDPYDEILTEFQTNIPDKARVWGNMMFWFGFKDQPYRTQYTYTKNLYDFKPEYVITNDEGLWGREYYKTGIISKSHKWSDVTKRIQEYCENYGRVIHQTVDHGYGKIKIWKINTSRIPKNLN